jgi:hypothetical protein
VNAIETYIEGYSLVSFLTHLDLAFTSEDFDSSDVILYLSYSFFDIKDGS